MVYEDRVFEIREYDNFPVKQDSDEVVQTFDTLESAQFESMWLNKKAQMGERYYVIDVPHEEVTLTKQQRELLKERFGLK